MERERHLDAVEYLTEQNEELKEENERLKRQAILNKQRFDLTMEAMQKVYWQSADVKETYLALLKQVSDYGKPEDFPIVKTFEDGVALLEGQTVSHITVRRGDVHDRQNGKIYPDQLLEVLVIFQNGDHLDLALGVSGDSLEYSTASYDPLNRR